MSIKCSTNCPNNLCGVCLIKTVKKHSDCPKHIKSEATRRDWMPGPLIIQSEADKLLKRFGLTKSTVLEMVQG